MRRILSQIEFVSEVQVLGLCGFVATLVLGLTFVFHRVGKRRGRKWRLLDDSFLDIFHFQRRDWFLVALTISVAICFAAVALGESA